MGLHHGRFKGQARDADSMDVLVTNHVLAGAAIGAACRRRPAAAFALGIASHLAMDVCHHWGLPEEHPDRHQRFLEIARRDGLTGLAAIAAVAAGGRRHRRALLAGMAGAALLDVDKPSLHFFGRSPFPPAVDAFHNRIQIGRESPEKMGQELRLAASLALGLIGLALLSR
jgi:hypothetical protein